MEFKLSHKLLDLGFFSALGTSEHPGMRKEGVPVKRGRPNTYDSNNGVMVVYDEDGRPWIKSNDLQAKGFKIDSQGYHGTFADMIQKHDLQRGAIVPHSNDGGYFVQKVIPTLVDDS